MNDSDSHTSNVRTPSEPGPTRAAPTTPRDDSAGSHAATATPGGSRPSGPATARRPAAGVAAWGALLAALGVAAGAFGAHQLATRIDEAHLRAFETGVRYQLLHAIALVAIGLSSARPELARLPAALLFAGVLLFSGSLYALALGGPAWLGPVTPLGGLVLILGWLTLAYRLFSRA